MTATGVLEYICISTRKGTVKQPVSEAVLKQDHGILGDAHAGDWHRQVSLLDTADIDSMRNRGYDLQPGAFGENLAVSGLDFGQLGIGSLIGIGGVELELTQIGKVCHHRCAIYDVTGDCIMPHAGLFARVNRGDELTPGMQVTIARLVPRATIQAAVLTVSDRGAAGESIDTAGPACVRILEEKLAAHVAWTGIVPDSKREITEAVKRTAVKGVDLFLTVGGTGCGPRDRTPEATREFIDREVPGLAEAMRLESMKITPHAMLQRGVCGIYGSTLIINLPGSEKAACENLAVILPALKHAVDLLRGKTAHDD